MGGERGEVLFDGLLVPDIDKHLVEYRHPRGVVGGDGEAVGEHQRQYAHSLHGNRFATRVGAGDQEGLIGVAQREGERYDGLAVAVLLQPMEEEGRVAAIPQVNDAFGVQRRHHRVQFVRQLGLGLQQIQHAEDTHILAQWVELAPEA